MPNKDPIWNCCKANVMAGFFKNGFMRIKSTDIVRFLKLNAALWKAFSNK